MANGSFNASKGKIRNYAEEARDTAGSALVVVLLKAVEADDTLNNYDTLSALLGAAGNTEADFTNYQRFEVSGANVTVTVDDSNNLVDLDIPDQVWDPAGGTTNNTLVKALICFDPDTAAGDDTTVVPLDYYDFSTTTDGTKLTMQIAAAGFHRTS